jgi:hypothetical protein
VPGASPNPSGYSGTPLPQKLGIKPDTLLVLVGAPDGFAETLGALPEGVEVATELGWGAVDSASGVVMLFTSSRAELDDRRSELGRAIFPAGSLWVCWPKRASKVPTDITEDVVREVVLPHGLVDVKVCAIDATWSGLKLMWRNDRRTPT